MSRSKFIFNLAILSLILLLPRFSGAAVPHAFSPGDPILASEVNNNFNDLDQRSSNLEAGVRPATRTFIDVDCNANPDAFQQSPLIYNFHPYTTFNITGNWAKGVRSIF